MMNIRQGPKHTSDDVITKSITDATSDSLLEYVDTSLKSMPDLVTFEEKSLDCVKK